MFLFAVVSPSVEWEAKIFVLESQKDEDRFWNAFWLLMEAITQPWSVRALFVTDI